MDRLETMRAFVEVARQSGFAPAARHLGMSTSALSRHIMSLEDWLGVQLFHRNTRHVQLTDAGQGYLDRCVKVLDDVRDIEKLNQETHSELSGSIRISAPVFLGRTFVAPTLSKTLLANPRFRAELFLSDRQVDLIGEGFDLAVRVAKPEDSSLIARRLTSVRICVVGSPAYLAEHGSPAKLGDLKNHRCVIDRLPDGADRWKFATSEGGRTQKIEGQVRVNDGEAARNFAVAGLGLARLPMFFVEDALEQGQLVEIDFENDTEEAAVYAVYPPSRHLSRGVRALIDLMVREARN